MKNKNEIYDLVLASLFLAMAIIFPFFTGQIPQIGSMLCPMHIPIILCGFICGWKYGLFIGFFAPLLRSLMLGRPPLFPTAFSMAFELGTYGLIAGLFYNNILDKIFKKRDVVIYFTLCISMIIGRIVYGSVMFVLMGFNKVEYSFQLFWIGTVVESIPGILLQLILIPIVIMVYEKYKKS